MGLIGGMGRQAGGHSGAGASRFSRPDVPTLSPRRRGRGVESFPASPPPSPQSTSSVQRIGATSLYALKQALRQKLLHTLVLFALVVMAAALILGQLSAGEERKILIDVGLSALRLFGLLMALLLGVSLAAKEIERQTIQSLVAKPLRRFEFILGKFFGLGVALLISVGVMAVGVWLALIYTTGRVSADQALLLPAVFLIYLELLLIASLALTFSTFSSPMLSVILTILLFIVGNLSGDLLTLADAAPSAAALVYRVLYYGLPNLQSFNFILPVAHGQAVPLSLLGASTAYAMLYTIVVLVVAMNIFERRDLK